MNIPEPTYPIQRYDTRKGKKLYVKVELGTCEKLRLDMTTAFERFRRTVTALTRYFFEDYGMDWSDWTIGVERMLYHRHEKSRFHRRIRSLGEEVDTAIIMLSIAGQDHCFENGEVWIRCEIMIAEMERAIEKINIEYQDKLIFEPLGTGADG